MAQETRQGGDRPSENLLQEKGSGAKWWDDKWWVLAATGRRKLQLHQRGWQVMRGTHIHSLLLVGLGRGGGWGKLVLLTGVRAAPWFLENTHQETQERTPGWCEVYVSVHIYRYISLYLSTYIPNHYFVTSNYLLLLSKSSVSIILVSKSNVVDKNYLTNVGKTLCVCVYIYTWYKINIFYTLK